MTSKNYFSIAGAQVNSRGCIPTPAQAGRTNEGPEITDRLQKIIARLNEGPVRLYSLKKIADSVRAAETALKRINQLPGHLVYQDDDGLIYLQREDRECTGCRHNRGREFEDREDAHICAKGSGAHIYCEEMRLKECGPQGRFWEAVFK